MTIRIGIGIATFDFEEPAGWFRFAERCEALGIDSLWQTDRLMGAAPQLEAMAAMAALAGATERIKFGMNAVVVTHRDPLVLARQCATIDVLSGGRLLPVFGVGAGRDPIFAATGRDPAGRGRQANEALTLLARLWTGESVDFEGEFYRYHGVQIAPRPKQQPLPLWIGGASKAAIRRTATLGTGWLAGLMAPDQVGPVIRSIRQALVETGRRIDDDHYGATVPFLLGAPDDPAVEAFARRVRAAGATDSGLVVAGDASALIDRIADYAAGGASKFVLLPLAKGEKPLLEQVERVAAEVRDRVEDPAFEAAALERAEVGGTPG